MQDSSDPHARLQTPQTTETEEKQNNFVAKKSKEGIFFWKKGREKQHQNTNYMEQAVVS